jgi:hypothetical protein
LPWIVALTGLFFLLHFAWKGITPFDRIILPSLMAVITLNFLLNIHFYPTLFHFTSTNQAAKAVRSRGQTANLKTLNYIGYGLDVYSQRTVPNYTTLAKLMASSDEPVVSIFTNERGHDEVIKSGVTILEETRFYHFHISTLSVLFLNPKTRRKEIENNYLLKINTSD